MQTYLLILKEREYSKLNHGWMYRLTWLDLDSLEQLETIVDESYSNYRHWDSIIRSAEYSGIYSGLKLSKRVTREGVAIVSADSVPELVEPVSNTECAELLEYLYQQATPTVRLF